MPTVTPSRSSGWNSKSLSCIKFGFKVGSEKPGSKQLEYPNDLHPAPKFILLWIKQVRGNKASTLLGYTLYISLQSD